MNEQNSMFLSFNVSNSDMHTNTSGKHRLSTSSLIRDCTRDGRVLPLAARKVASNVGGAKLRVSPELSGCVKFFSGHVLASPEQWLTSHPLIRTGLKASERLALLMLVNCNTTL